MTNTRGDRAQAKRDGLTIWRYKTRSGYVRETGLWLYPELDCSACIDDVYEEDGAAQLRYYCDYIKRVHPEWWEANAVPISWSVRQGVLNDFQSDFADCTKSKDSPYPTMRGFDTFSDIYSHPWNALTEEPLNFYHLPVKIDRFPAFAKALVWVPSPFQHYAPLRSIAGRY